MRRKNRRERDKKKVIIGIIIMLALLFAIRFVLLKTVDTKSINNDVNTENDETEENIQNNEAETDVENHTDTHPYDFSVCFAGDINLDENWGTTKYLDSQENGIS